MKSHRGYTLVELMICIALLGIIAAAAGLSSRGWRLHAQAEIERERAVLLLEYEADCLSTGRTIDPAVEARLKEPLREVQIERVARGGASGTLLTLRWAGPRGQIPRSREESLSLVVLTPGGR